MIDEIRHPANRAVNPTSPAANPSGSARTVAGLDGGFEAVLETAFRTQEPEADASRLAAGPSRLAEQRPSSEPANDRETATASSADGLQRRDQPEPAARSGADARSADPSSTDKPAPRPNDPGAKAHQERQGASLQADRALRQRRQHDQLAQTQASEDRLNMSRQTQVSLQSARSQEQGVARAQDKAAQLKSRSSREPAPIETPDGNPVSSTSVSLPPALPAAQPAPTTIPQAGVLASSLLASLPAPTPSSVSPTTQTVAAKPEQQDTLARPATGATTSVSLSLVKEQAASMPRSGTPAPVAPGGDPGREANGSSAAAAPSTSSPARPARSMTSEDASASLAAVVPGAAGANAPAAADAGASLRPDTLALLASSEQASRTQSPATTTRDAQQGLHPIGSEAPAINFSTATANSSSQPGRSEAPGRSGSGPAPRDGVPDAVANPVSGTRRGMDTGPSAAIAPAAADWRPGGLRADPVSTASGAAGGPSQADRLLASIQEMRGASGQSTGGDLSGNAGYGFAAQLAALNTSPSSASATAEPARLVNPWSIDDPAFLEHLAGQVSESLLGGIERAEITLTPRDLGPIRIELSLSGESASIAFSALQSETRAAIEQSLPILRELLADHGLMLSSTQVDDGSAGAGPGFSGGQSAGEGSGSGPSTRQDAPSVSTAVRADASPAAARATQGLLDLFA